MVRKLNLIIIVFISMFLMPSPLYAHGGLGGGHGGLGGHGLAGQSSFLGHRFGGPDRFANRGFNSGHFERRHHERFEEEEEEERFLFFAGVFFDFGVLFPLTLYPYYYPPYYDYPYYDYPYTSYSYAGQPYGDLVIQVTPKEVEIYVDGRFIGKTNDFKGPAVVLVSSGNHVVELKYNGSSFTINVKVAPGAESVVSKDFAPISQSSYQVPNSQNGMVE